MSTSIDRSSKSEEADLGIVYDEMGETFDEEKFLAELRKMTKSDEDDYLTDEQSSEQLERNKTSSKNRDKSKKSARRKPKRKSQKEQHLNLQQVVSDDTQGTAYTAKSVMSVWTIGTGFASNASYLDEDLDHLLHRSDMEYVKKRFGVVTLIVTLSQLLFLTMIISLCGFSTFASNPCIGPYPDALSNAGATNPYLIETEGQYWRFLTSPFIPASVIHFVLNSVVQLEVGAYLERQWGSCRWLAIYLFSGIGSVSFSCTLEKTEINVAGTGALMGLVGAQFSEFLKVSCFRTKSHRRYEDSYHQQILMLIIVLVSSLFSLIPYVSWAGNMGGLLHGFCAGMILLSSNFRNEDDRRLYVGYGIILAVLLIMIAISVLFERKAPDYLGDTCQLYDDIHVENYDCTCGF